MEQMKQDLVKVKILRYVGQWSPGDVVEMDSEAAKNLCAISAVHDGSKPVRIQKAILLADAERLADMPIDVKKMTRKEMEELGAKNIIETPKDMEITRIIAGKKKDKSEKIQTSPDEFMGGSSEDPEKSETIDKEIKASKKTGKKGA